MPTDLLSLALAAMMPLAAFAIYAGVRAVRDRRAHRRLRPRRTAGTARVSFTLPSRRAASRAVQGAPAPAADRPVPSPVQPPPVLVARLDERPVTPRQPPAPAQQTRVPTTAPVPDVLADWVEPPPPRAPAPARQAPVPVFDIPRSPSAPRTVARAGSAPFSSVRSLLRRDSRETQAPSWPDPALRDAETAIAAPEPDSGPCPFCEESRLRGAWFCRRCRRPVDPKAIAAIARVSSARAASVVPAAGEPQRLAPLSLTPPAPPALPEPGPLTTATADPRPPVPVSRPLISRVSVRRPVTDANAERPAASVPTETPSPASSQAPAGAAMPEPEPVAVPVPAPAAPRKRRRPSRKAPADAASSVAAEGPDAPSRSGEAPDSLSPTSGAPAAPRPVAIKPPGVVSTSRRASRGAPRELVAVGPGRSDDDDTHTTQPIASANSHDAAIAANGHAPSSDRVDLNRATVPELVRLKGVGRATAARIVSARDDEPFGTIEALIERGLVGRSVLEAVRDQVTV